MSDDNALTLEAFMARVAELRRRRPTRIRNALRRIVLPDSGASCWHCGQPAKHVEALIPERAGGTIRLENLVAACGPCRRNRGDLDPLEFAEMRGLNFTGQQVEQRLGAVSVSPASGVSLGTTTLYSARRNRAWPEHWAHPRIPMLLQEGGSSILVGLLQRNVGIYAGTCLLAIRAAGGQQVAPSIAQIDRRQWAALRPELVAQHAVVFLA